jgi:putative superfamily III holin-X
MATPSAKQGSSARELATGIVDDAQRLWELQLELAKQEAKEIAIRNLFAMGFLIGGGTLIFVVLFVVLPLGIIRLLGFSTLAVLIWLAVDTVAGLSLAFVGYTLLKVPDPKTTRSARALLETKEWLQRQISLNGR